MATVLITGGTGTVGKRLTTLLIEKGYSVSILTRNASDRKTQPGVVYKQWDVEKGTIDATAVTEADYIIHLAGAGVADGRWTARRKAEIVKSRTESSALLVKAAQNGASRLKAVVSSSAIGWYNPDDKRIEPEGFQENAPPAPGFLGETCKLWEESITPFAQMGKRLVILRTGLVLSNDGGVIAEFRKPLQYGMATIMGSGEQVMSWIHIDDLCRMYIYAMENEELSGPYNAVAPEPATSKTVVLTLAKQLRGKAFISMHVPSLVLKAMLGEMSTEVLKSNTVSAARIKAAGFQFQYPALPAAVEQLAKE